MEANTTIEQATKTIAKHEATISSLTTKKEAAETSLKEALAKIKEQATLINSLGTEAKEGAKALEAALVEVGTLAGKLDLQEKHGRDGRIVEVGGKSLKLIGNSFLYGGSRKTAKELSKDKAQLAIMVKAKSGSLVALD